MYWIITSAFAFAGTIAAWKILTYLWNKYDPIIVRSLPMLRAGHHMPGEYKYMDLKFSLARHAFMFLVTAAIMFWVESSIIINIFFYGYGFYTASVIVRYIQRKDILKALSNEAESAALVEILTKPFKDSRVVLIYSICAEVVIFVLYFIRP